VPFMRAYTELLVTTCHKRGAHAIGGMAAFIPSRKDPAINEVKAGDKLSRLNGWDWSAHDRTLVLALRKGCHFCEDSAPFYQRLLSMHKQHGSTTAIVAVFPDAAANVKEVVESEGLGLETLPGVSLEELNVVGTPTLLFVDRHGTVLNAWSGVLTPKQEFEVVQETICNGRSC